MIYWLTTNLWTTGQGVVTRRLMPRPAAPVEALEPDAPEGGAGRVDQRRADALRRHAAPEHELGGRSAQSQAKARREDTAMSESGAVTVEATGETVGEAKWAALRELEQLVPGLDRESVQFQVVSEGERGLLGVGFTPAHVIASTDAPSGARHRRRERRSCGRPASSSSASRQGSARMSRRPRESTTPG